MRRLLFAIPLMAALGCGPQTENTLPEPVLPLPKEAQIQWQQMETYAFIHFGPNTFSDVEWGYGDFNPKDFNPDQLDCRQWVRVLKSAGMKGVILTAKHHDGFCLWPSEYTDYSVKSTPYKKDIVAQLSEACKEAGLKFGVYLSPWDRHQANYGEREYVDYYKNQLKELLTNYGDIFEVWFDGANGGDGYYGGARENRTIDKRNYYHFNELFAIVDSLQPNAVIFSDGGPGCRWVGNEKGFAGEVNWSFLRSKDVYPGYPNFQELPNGHKDGDQWSASECDVSIRPGWFYHEAEDSLVRTPDNLLQLYLNSVGRNGTLLLNIPVNRHGLISQYDSASIVQFHERVGRIFSDNLLKHCDISSDCTRGERFQENYLTDGDYSTFWSVLDSTRTAKLTFISHKPITFNTLVLQEFIGLGQRVEKFSILYQGQDGNLLSISTNDTTATIGYKRIITFDDITTERLEISFDKSRGPVCISEIGAYRR